MRERLVLVFHCEFSQKRAPFLWRALKDLDRLINHENYPNIFFPEAYLLEGGFSQFQPAFPDLCNGTYLRENAETEKCRSRWERLRRNRNSYCVKQQASKLMTKWTVQADNSDKENRCDFNRIQSEKEKVVINVRPCLFTELNQ